VSHNVNANAVVYIAGTAGSPSYITSIKSTTVHIFTIWYVHTQSIRIAGRQETNLKSEYFYFVFNFQI
jgi:hypothetical protein